MRMLPNMRLFGLSSQGHGRDWFELSQKIDREIEELGWDLAEEVVLVDFSFDEVKVYRSVIGGLKEVNSPWILKDLVGGEFSSQTIQGNNWEEVLEQISQESFTVFLRRRLKPELTLTVEVVSSLF